MGAATRRSSYAVGGWRGRTPLHQAPGPSIQGRLGATFSAGRWNRRSTFGEIVRQFWWAAALALRWATAPALALLALQLVAGVAPAASVRITQHVINLAIASAGRGAAALGPIVPWLGALALAMIVTRGPIWYLRAPLDQRIDQRLHFHLERARLNKATRLPLLFYEASESYDQLSRGADGGRKVHHMFRNGLGLVEGGIAVVTTALLFHVVYPWWPAVLVAVLVPLSIREAEINRQWMSFTYDQTEEQRRVGYVGGLLTGRGEQKEMRVFNLHLALGARWRDLRRTLRAAMLRQKRRGVMRGLPTQALSLGTTVATAFVLAMALADHRISTGAFVALFGGIGTVQGAMHRIVFSVRDLQTGATDVDYVRDFLALPETDAGPERAGRGPFPEPLRRGIHLEGVSFAYPGRSEPVLDRIDLHLRPGERVALVGSNGSGKSTLAKLLLGLYLPQGGRITADGTDYLEIDPESLHSGVSAVYQDYYCFPFTARESVGIGQVAKIDDLEAVRAAARVGGADAFIAALPRGYDTPVGHVLDGGTGLSGGQWQRIAVARAFMRGPQLLILDEPTAALDPKAEAQVYERLSELLDGRAALLISHRLGSARLADRILVLHGGRIAEDGTHAELLVLGGRYARMWEEQAQWYR